MSQANNTQTTIDLSAYADWIAAEIKTTYGECAEATSRMLEVFPELTRVRGHYYCPIWGERAHWWLVTDDGKIVDPTKDQFPSKGIGHYEPWIEGSPEPTGMCANCGELVYDGGTVCSEVCGRAYVAFCSQGWGYEH